MAPLVWVLLALVGCARAFAQNTATDEVPVFRADSRLAVVGLHVIANRQYVTGLKASDFELLEDGQPRRIVVFEGGQGGPRSLPVEIVLLFDNSGSVTGAGLLDAKLFRDDLLAGLPEAALSVYSFGNRLERMSGPTRDAAKLRQAFQGVVRKRPGEATFQIGKGDSLIYEAVAAAARECSRSPQPATRLLLVVSDGLPGGETDLAKAASVAQAAGIPVYPLVVGHRARELEFQMRMEAPAAAGESPGAAAARGNAGLKEFQRTEEQVAAFASLGESTGGRSFDPPQLDPETVRRIIQFLADQVRYLYVVGYSPDFSSTPRAHNVEVRLRGQRGARLSGARRIVVH